MGMLGPILFSYNILHHYNKGVCACDGSIFFDGKLPYRRETRNNQVFRSKNFAFVFQQNPSAAQGAAVIRFA